MPRVSFRDRREGGRGDGRAHSRSRRLLRCGPAALLALLSPACAPAPRVDHSLSPPRVGFEVGRDSFAFPNEVRAEHPEKKEVFGNYCIVMARTAGQFFRFARFAPDRPPETGEAYTRLTRAVIASPPWAEPRPEGQRIVIPGYADLHAFSRAQETAIKAAFDSSVLSIMHWRTWRVLRAFSPDQQEGVADELGAEVGAGRPAPLMITNFPGPDVLNHAVLVYDARPGPGLIEFLAYDPNDPGGPLSIYFDRRDKSFWVGSLPYGGPGRIRAFRLFASPLL